MNTTNSEYWCAECGHASFWHQEATVERYCAHGDCGCQEFALAGLEGVSAARDTQVGGDHYNRAIQIWDIVEVWELGFFRGSALKYLLRAGNKGPALDDLRKARHYIDKCIEREEAADG